MLRYWYDDNGNMIRQQQGAEEVLYRWDTYNRLIQVQYADGTSQSFVYSDDGLRKRVVERDGRILDFVWDGSNLLGIVDAGTGALQARFTHADGGDDALLSQHTQAGSRFYGFDQSANTRLLSDATGDVSDRYSYSAFGAARQVLGSSFNPHRFGGRVGYFQDQQWRAYVRARHLDMQAGRWLSADPIGFDGDDFNLYRYAGNNPTISVDSFGTSVWQIGQGRPANSPYPPNLSNFGTKPGSASARDVALAAILKSDISYLARLAGGYAQMGSLSAAGPYATLWFKAQTSVLKVNMEPIMEASRSECDSYASELRAAVRFAEKHTRVGMPQFSKGQYITASVGKANNDLWWRIGNHSAWANAVVSIRGGSTYDMSFTWTLEDVFTLDKPTGETPFANWHEKGLARDFVVTGSISRMYTWKKGKFPYVPCPWQRSK